MPSLEAPLGSMEPYVVLEKAVGQTPLQCLDLLRAARPELATTPLTYAGRLDPMATGKLLVLIGEECKQKQAYLALDKEYEFSVLLGVHSDSGDILGIVSEVMSKQSPSVDWRKICRSLLGPITLPYPQYSSKTIQGKPLHTWASEGRISEIDLPLKESNIYKLSYLGSRSVARNILVHEAITKITLLPEVTDKRKALGNDFRRPDVYASWRTIAENGAPEDRFTIATFRCIASSGTYMRSLAEVLAEHAGTQGLAFSIHRTTLGTYRPLWRNFGYWQKRIS